MSGVPEVRHLLAPGLEPACGEWGGPGDGITMTPTPERVTCPACIRAAFSDMDGQAVDA